MAPRLRTEVLVTALLFWAGLVAAAWWWATRPERVEARRRRAAQRRFIREVNAAAHRHPSRPRYPRPLP